MFSRRSREVRVLEGAGKSTWRRLRVLLRVVFVLLGALPLLVAFLPHGQTLDLLRAWGERAYAFQCHQGRARGIDLFGALLPVCARCFGIYIGLGAGALTGRPRLTDRALVGWLASAMLMMLLDVATEVLGLRPASTVLRLATGLSLAYPVGIAVARLDAEHETE